MGSIFGLALALSVLVVLVARLAGSSKYRPIERGTVDVGHLAHQYRQRQVAETKRRAVQGFPPTLVDAHTWQHEILCLRQDIASVSAELTKAQAHGQALPNTLAGQHHLLGLHQTEERLRAELAHAEATLRHVRQVLARAAVEAAPRTVRILPSSARLLPYPAGR